LDIQNRNSARVGVERPGRIIGDHDCARPPVTTGKLFLAFLGLVPVVLAGCSDASSADPRTQAPMVRVGVVGRAVESERSFTGIVAARVESDLGFRVPGKVTERLVDTGQAVKRGQPLLRIDPTDLRLGMRANEEAVISARARARQTAEDEVRFRDLVARGAVSASEYDQARAAAESARADLNAAEARAGVARNETSYAALLADADGVVLETLAEPGQVVAAGQAVVRLAHAGHREAIIELPETLRPAIGSSARATLYGSSLGGSAKLRQLSDAANRQTRTFEARYVLEDRLADAPLGATVSIQIPAVQVANSASVGPLQVPIGAVFDPGTGPGVWVVEGKTPRVTWHAVQLAGLSDEAVSIVGDVKAGDRVVALGAHLLHEGERVRIAAQEAASGETLSRVARQ
jgi:RND family efflux transporter MFP subunit